MIQVLTTAETPRLCGVSRLPTLRGTARQLPVVEDDPAMAAGALPSRVKPGLMTHA